MPATLQIWNVASYSISPRFEQSQDIDRWKKWRDTGTQESAPDSLVLFVISRTAIDLQKDDLNMETIKHYRHIIVPAGIILALITLIGVRVQPVTAQGFADLSITKHADRSKVKIGEQVTYTITLTNLGPEVATGIVFADTEPDSLVLVSFVCNQGTIIPPSGCAIDSLASGAGVSATLVATPLPLGKQREITNLANVVTSSSTDPNSSNNSMSATIKVIGKLPP